LRLYVTSCDVTPANCGAGSLNAVSWRGAERLTVSRAQ
jgi:hypothetical protein